MTDREKDILIEKMLEAPGQLSPGEITAILADDELRDIYGISVRLKTALRRPPAVDTADEWKRFSKRITVRRRRPLIAIMRCVAAVVALLLVSVAIVRLTAGDGDADIQDILADSKNTVDSAAVVLPATDDSAVPAPESAPCVNAAEAKPHVAAAPRRKTQRAITPAVQAERYAEADIDHYIKVEQARIDNDVAMAMAEAYKAMYVADMTAEMSQLQGEVAVNLPEIKIEDVDINQIIML